MYLVLVFFTLQFLLGAGIVIWSIIDWYDTQHNESWEEFEKEEYFGYLAKATKWARIGGIVALTSPLAIFSVPLAVLSGIVFGVYKLGKFAIPVFKTYRSES